MLEKLATLGLEQSTTEHDAAFTVEEQTKAIGHLRGSMTKNLFLRDKKHGLFLVTAGFNREVNMKAVQSMLGLSGANMRFGDETLLQDTLGVVKGSVSPFALMNDTEKKVKFCIDKALLSAEMINIHPCRNDRTTSVTPAVLKGFLDHYGFQMTILDFDNAPSPPAALAGGKGGKQQKAAKPAAAKKEMEEGATGLDLTVTKDGDFSKWYTEVITKAEMIDYSDIGGCYILRPWSYFIWEQIQSWFDAEIKKGGVKNTYFPIFVSKGALEREKDHLEGFAPEVAWVTKSGESEMQEPIAVRPTSETIMYPFFAKWIRSHRDLPLKINQWANVVRWEFKDATPFLRSREFLWQEGHTAHTTNEECQETVRWALDLYRQVYEDLLAVPVIPGQKTEGEKFAGGTMTTTVEAYINGSGRAIQGATSHNLGQNFGKMFKIQYENEEGKHAMPYQASWGLTTRTIGVAVMVHGDDKGLVLPPRVAPTQVIIVPILKKESQMKEIDDYAYDLKDLLEKTETQHGPLRVEVDSRKIYTPGWKFNHWEQKGVPLRIEVGPRDVEGRQARLVRRDNGAKIDVAWADLASTVSEYMVTIQKDMFDKAKAGRDAKLVKVMTWEEFVPALNEQCLALTPFCDEDEWEEKVKTMSREQALNGAEEADTCATSVAAKTLCKPFDQPPLPEGTPCFVSGKPATCWCLWGRSY